ncbi:hypothetical protein BH11ARM2_BH11ARM2_35850 [soil metagenome]
MTAGCGLPFTRSGLAKRTYDAFGRIDAFSGSWSGPSGYGGRFGYQEDGSGLSLLGHRWYDSEVGRFLTRDPAKDGPNRYAYCGNDPVGSIDWSGKRPVRITINALRGSLEGHGFGHSWITIHDSNGKDYVIENTKFGNAEFHPDEGRKPDVSFSRPLPPGTTYKQLWGYAKPTSHYNLIDWNCTDAAKRIWDMTFGGTIGGGKPSNTPSMLADRLLELKE